MKKMALVVAMTSLTLGGCMTYDPYTGEEEVSKSTTGAVVGAIGGAAVGAATSSDSDRGKGALIGATAGAAAGGGIGYYMDRQEAKLRKQLKDSGVQVKRDGDQIRLIMPGNITFQTDQASIQSSFTDVLVSVSKVLKEFDETAIRISGHTDSTGSASYNQLLSEKRAGSVRDFLLNQGIAPARTQAVGYGERQPIASNESESGRAQNRRAELKLVPIKQ